MCLYMYDFPGKVHIFERIAKSICAGPALTGASASMWGGTHLSCAQGGLIIIPVCEVAGS